MRYVQLTLGLLLVFLVRLVPFRPPNVEPLMATMMPFAKEFGPIWSMLFPALSIVLFDVMTSGLGIWTTITAATYGLLGIAAYVYFRSRAASVRNYVSFAIVATLVYDACTGLTIGPLVWHQPFLAALLGQIPFTIMHLAGNVLFAAVLSPVVHRFLTLDHALLASRHTTAQRRFVGERVTSGLQ